jgi:putative two-component system response regulator
MDDKNIPKVLICDDVLENRKLLASTLQRYAKFDLTMISDGATLLSKVEEIKPDIILLDIMMPEIDGYEVAKQLKSNPATDSIPIIFITALDQIESKMKAFDMGGVDYISKPFSPKEIIIRINNHLKLAQMMARLEEEVRERTQELESLNYALILALENANYYSDIETGAHIHRVNYYSRLLAQSLSLPEKEIQLIARYAPIHDIGKVGIPTEILKKKGKLTPEEFDKIKEHSYIGYKIIDLPGIPSVAKNIVYYHHERWDGSGYPSELKGESIPIEARIMALADVYDALRTERPYKSALAEDETVRIIEESSGTHFDPKVVDAFLKNRTKFNDVFKRLSQLDKFNKE